MGFFSFSAHCQEEPDFDYPQKVSKDALAQLKKAQRSGDGQMMVDALVRYSIAKGKVSQESMDTIITQIEDVKKKENRADYKAILNFLEAYVFKSYHDAYCVYDRENPKDEPLPADYTEWDNNQFQAKIKELINAALADEEALKQCPIGNYSKIFIDGDEMGAVYVPTLYQALCRHCYELLNDDESKKDLEHRWLKSCKEGTAEWMYAADETLAIEDDFAEYQKYKDNEHSAIFLLNTLPQYHYADYKEYVNRFPNSYYTPSVLNKIYDVEKQYASISCDKNLSSTDSLKIDAYFNNVNNAEVRIYRYPDKLLKDLENGSVKNFDIKNLELVRTHQIQCPGVVPFYKHMKYNFPPLPFGQYVIIGAFTNGEGVESVDKDLNRQDYFLVHDLTMFNAGGEGFPQRVFTVDTRNGAPQSGVNLDINSTHDRIHYPSTAITDKDGSALLPTDKNYYSHEVTASRGDDKYNPSMTVYTNRNGYSDNRVSARVFTDLNIYRPGETVKFAAILNIITTEQMSPLENKKVRVIFCDANNQAIDTIETESDAFGRVTGEFKIPTDRLNGQFRLKFYTGDKFRDNLGTEYVNVSEYKTPTFTVSFPDARQVFTRNQPVKITGKAMTYSGVPVPNAEVKLNLYRNEWSWWWRWSTKHGENIMDTVITTDEKGEFTIELPASSFKENQAKYYYYNYVLEAQCTNEAGESQEASHCFIIGSRRGVKLAENKDFNNIAPIKLPLTFNSTDENEKGVECYYKIEDEKENVVASGT
ncbi:MAG: hypothetical protein IKX63_06470, partial [Muribaculaceae bacterium]|nr:hypothetical protein [Muribaculaceae bacterium]